ncbi:MAG: BamA/TamA family outer membrane protein, partial [Gemmatimonadota bacterium]
SAPDSVPGVATVRSDTTLETHDYDPLPTLRPRFWEPVWAPAVRSRGVDVIEPSLGVLTSAEDLVGRHAVDAQLLVSLSDRRVSGSVGYAYRGLGNPVLSARVSQGWDAGARRAVVEQDTVDLFLVERERNASLAATFLRRRVRRSLSLMLSGGMAWEGRSLLDADLSESALRLARPDVRLTDLRASAGFSTARGHAFSVSAEEGLSVSVTGRTRDELDVPADARGVLGLDRSVDEVYGQLRGYLDLPGPGFADHVLALRVSAGLARGPGADPSHYDVGGVAGGREPFTGLGLFGGTARFFPVRGFENGDRSGREAWSATLEYRFPLALVNEGLGLIPIHLDRVSGSVFLDAGNAWGPEEGGDFYRDNLRRDALASTGVEVLTDVLTFFSIPVTLRAGVAFPLRVREGAVGYVSFGRPF